jgi:LPS-assembly protein
LTALAAALVAFGAAGPAIAQDAGAATASPAAAQQESPISYEADEVEYHNDTDTIIANGNVVLRRDNRSVRADTVTWNNKTGQIVATGNVHLVDENGNELFSDRANLTDEFKTGAMQNMLLALREGGRLAAASGERAASGQIILNNAAYTACAVQNSSGCPKEPTWKITARQVVYDDTRHRVRFKGARLTFFGAIRLPLPGMVLSTNGEAISGLLIPDFRFSPSNGVEIDLPYYVRFSDNRDLTATAHLYSDVLPMASIAYRELNSLGAYQITAYGTDSRLIPVGNAPGGSEADFRGYIFANGRFQLTPNWSATFSIRRTTDRTFLRRYDISRDDRLRSMLDVERIDANSYFSFSGWATQTLRVGDKQGQVPIALPIIDYRQRLADPVLGGRVELQANSLAISRTSGQNTQRAFASARWDLQRLTPWGQEITLTGMVRGDIYHSSDNDLTTTAIYRGEPGWQARGMAIAALDVQWPLVGTLFGGTQVLTPRLQIVATPPIRNLAVPNEDARAVDLEDSNLFALNRFPGYDRVEDGVRVTYGFDWQFERPRWRIKTTIGQSYRLTGDRSLLPLATGLADRLSDIVGRTEIQYRNLVKLTHRFRIDKDSFAFRRNEFDASIGNNRTYLEVDYIKLNRDTTAGLEDLQNREELSADGRIAFARYWSLFGSAVINLTDKKEDPVLGSNGFQPLRTRFGAAYQDDCLEIAVTWRRDYVTTGDARKGNTFQIYFALRNIGFH